MLQFYGFVFLSFAVFAGGGIFVSYRLAKAKGIFFKQWAKEWYADFSTELAGAGLGVFLLGLILFALQEQEAQNSLKAYLKRQMVSTYNAVALGAIEELRAHDGWLEEVLPNANLYGADLHTVNFRGLNLQGINLTKANLEDAYLSSANLNGARLVAANLNGASLYEANLEGALMGHCRSGAGSPHPSVASLQRVDFTKANLQGVCLYFGNLEGANLQDANFQGVDLGAANLKNTIIWGTDFRGANLTAANLKGATMRIVYGERPPLFDENTTLPDGHKWSTTSDFKRFIDPTHPDFWASPMYSGE